MANDLLRSLKRYTDARIGLARTGDALATTGWLALREAHAAARDAVLFEDVQLAFPGAITVHSLARDRREYLLRPDLGRRLAPCDIGGDPCDVAIVVADGLSALAVERHVGSVIAALRPLLDGLTVSPPVVARQARVAIGDEIGERLNARVVLVLIGERPGLSSADSLGAYLTFAPRVGRTDAERNCISNIRDGGLDYATAAIRLNWLIRESLRSKLSGVTLKEDTGKTTIVRGTSQQTRLTNL